MGKMTIIPISLLKQKSIIQIQLIQDINLAIYLVKFAKQMVMKTHIIVLNVKKNINMK